MARIRASQVHDGTRVSISGRLAAPDMGRLERACGEALTRHPLQLHLDLTHVTEMDDTAMAVVDRLRHRGARIDRVNTDAVSGESDGGAQRRRG